MSSGCDWVDAGNAPRCSVRLGIGAADRWCKQCQAAHPKCTAENGIHTVMGPDHTCQTCGGHFPPPYRLADRSSCLWVMDVNRGQSAVCSAWLGRSMLAEWCANCKATEPKTVPRDPPYYGCPGCTLTWANEGDRAHKNYPTKETHGRECDSYRLPPIACYKLDRAHGLDCGSRGDWLASIGATAFVEASRTGSVIDPQTWREEQSSASAVTERVKLANDVRAALNGVIAAEAAFKDAGKTRADAYDAFEDALKKLEQAK